MTRKESKTTSTYMSRERVASLLWLAILTLELVVIAMSSIGIVSVAERTVN